MPERLPYNAPGQCKVTGEYIFDVLTSHDRDSLLPGRPISIGEPLSNAERCYFLRTNGDLVQITICTNALDEGVDLINLNNEIARGLVWETVERNRLLIGAAPLDAVQKQSSLRLILEQLNAPIIVLYSRQLWSDVKLRERVVGNG